MEAFLRELIERRDALESGVFEHPCATWEDYQRRMGRWCELTEMINAINGKIEQGEENG